MESRNKPIVIVSAGFYRSGSTWLFNAIKQVCLAGELSVAQTGQAVLQKRVSEDVIIHKTHIHSAELQNASDFVFLSSRKIRDCQDSFVRAFGHEIEEAPKKASLEATWKWKQIGIVFGFEQIVSAPLSIVHEIAKALKLDIDEEETLKKIQAIKPPTDKIQDLDSFYFTNHITRKT